MITHEFTHSLGFAGLCTSSGTSEINGTDPGVFSLITQSLQRSNGTPLFAAGGNFTGIALELISNDIVFGGVNAMAANGGIAPKIYAPGTFAPGSSLSHLDTATYPAAVMKHAISSGTTAREYTAIEIGILQDIGYPDASAPITELAEAWVDFAFAGSEQGSTTNPYNTLQEAIDILTPAGVINIKGDTADSDTTEAPRIIKTMTVDAINGDVRIGVAAKAGKSTASILDTPYAEDTIALANNVALSLGHGEQSGTSGTAESSIGTVPSGKNDADDRLPG